MKIREVIGEAIFWTHFAIVAGWVALFFIPSDIWREKVSVHFIATTVILAHQAVWGFLLSFRTGRFGLVCILTTLMHMARGERIDTKMNYDRKWSVELCDRFGINISSAMANGVAIAGLAVISVQYFILHP